LETPGSTISPFFSSPAFFSLSPRHSFFESPLPRVPLLTVFTEEGVTLSPYCCPSDGPAVGVSYGGAGCQPDAITDFFLIVDRETDIVLLKGYPILFSVSCSAPDLRSPLADCDRREPRFSTTHFSFAAPFQDSHLLSPVELSFFPRRRSCGFFSPASRNGSVMNFRFSLCLLNYSIFSLSRVV